MTLEEAAAILSKAYRTAPEGEKALRIHLFGIEYADQIATMSCQEIAIRAGIKKSYGVEINKGRRLAEFVRLK
jgi:hypothetical protein